MSKGDGKRPSSVDPETYGRRYHRAFGGRSCPECFRDVDVLYGGLCPDCRDTLKEDYDKHFKEDPR